MTHAHSITVLMGPTASGKSALALRIAQASPTVIINADAMQLVADLRVLSARPSRAEEAAAEHALYGVLDAAEPTSVARWLGLVAPVVRAAWEAGRQPLLVGGTGMYVQALMQGLAAVPPIPPALRLRLRAMDAAAVRAALEACDPAMAAQLKPGDSQRNLRALEVWEATGKSLSDWQQQKTVPLFSGTAYRCFVLTPPRDVLYARINARFTAMLEAGALEEVARLMHRNLPADTPILRAHGVPELMAYARGEMTRDAAIALGQQHTRNYAKRQLTWIRQQMTAAMGVDADAPVDIFMEM